MQAIFSVTDIDPKLVAGVIANAIKKEHPQLTGTTEERKSLIAANFPLDSQLLKPTELGDIVGDRTGKKLSPRMINKLLTQQGFQIKNDSDNPAYVPTEKGKEYGRVTLNTALGNDKTVQNLRWFVAVLDILTF